MWDGSFLDRSFWGWMDTIKMATTPYTSILQKGNQKWSTRFGLGPALFWTPSEICESKYQEKNDKVYIKNCLFRTLILKPT